MQGSLEGRVVVVTGASGGIGEAIAQSLSDAGGAVALLARRTDRIEALAEQLSANAAPSIAVTADVTDAQTLYQAAQVVAERLGRVDCLVNNAGQMLLSPFTARRTAEWRRMVEINLLGAMMVTDAFLPALLDGGGDLVNISSIAGRKVRPTASVYSATKWGFGGWSEGLRQELQHQGVRVTLIEPGAVRTELADHISDEAIQARTRALLDEVDALHPEDVANAVRYAVTQPARVSVNELLIRPTLQEY